MGLLATLAEGAATSGAEAVLFWVFAAIALGSAVAVVALRNVVHAALMLVVNLLSVAALYLGLQSSFLSIVQVIVYAGAIVVLFLFVIMLLGVDRDEVLTERIPWQRPAATRPISGRPNCSRSASLSTMPREAPGMRSSTPLRCRARRCSSAALADRKPNALAISARVGGRLFSATHCWMNSRTWRWRRVSSDMVLPV